MYARVVRFTGVTSEQVASIASRVENEGPPPGVEPTGAELFFDESQATAVFVGYFESEEKLKAADAIFDQMDTSDTPGSRASVDLAEIKVQRSFK